MSIKIILADDHKILREGLKALIVKAPGMDVVAEAKDGKTAVRLVDKFSPDVTIMDISMPDLNGIEATNQIIAKNPDAKVIALSIHSDKRFVSNMLKAGAKGYLLKGCAFEELVKAIQTVLAGRVYLSPGIDQVVVSDYIQRITKPQGSTSPELTSREREIIQLIAEGRSTKNIAGHLHLSVKTIETHRHQAMDKLEIKSVAGLTKYAIREGLTSIDL
jgi:DNA-binding NarL/FixJ family response regulator